MASDRIHRAISRDGTPIAGRVHGHGPPVVMVGAVEDGDLTWESVVPHLADRYTCYLMSTRGRGLSGDDHDHSPDRLVDDVVAFVESIGEPVGLVGESGGAAWALGAAGRTDAISALAVYEPAVLEAFSAADLSHLDIEVARMVEAAAEGRLEEALRIFFGVVATEDELAAIPAHVIDATAPYVPTLLRDLKGLTGAEGPGPTDPSVLAAITAPVLVLHGSQTALKASFTSAVHHVSQHVAHTHVVELAGAGHFGYLLHPEAVATELLRFLDHVHQPA